MHGVPDLLVKYMVARHHPEHYKSMMGKTIDSIEYYTTNGVYTMDIADIYVPVKSETTKSEVADADIAAGKTTINVQPQMDLIRNTVWMDWMCR